MHLQLEQFSRKSVEIEPNIIEMLSPIELTQYYIQVRFNCLDVMLSMSDLVRSSSVGQAHF